MMLVSTLLASSLAFSTLALPQDPVDLDRASALVRACAERAEVLRLDPSFPGFELWSLCGGRVVVVAPEGHDLEFFLPNPGGMSTEKAALEPALEQVFAWLESDTMRPAAAAAAAAAGAAEAVPAGGSSSAASAVPALATPEQPLVLLVLNRLEERQLFNLRYSQGTILEEVVYVPLRPFGHEDCIGAPCAIPGSCGDRTGCGWEVHVPYCELVNRSTSALMQRRYGELPAGLTGFAEILEVAITGGHYSYRHFGQQAKLMPTSDRDGYADEFRALVEEDYRKTDAREDLLAGLLDWRGERHDARHYAASWGLAQTLLAFGKSAGRGKDARSLGDLLLEIGQMEDAGWPQILERLQAHDPKLLKNLSKKLPSKVRKKGPAALLAD